MDSCPICAKRFARKDSLKRHVRMHENGPRLRRKSCNFCQRSKIKCSGTRPQCTECARRNAPCEWPATHDHNTSRRRPLSSSAEWPPSAGNVTGSISIAGGLAEHLQPPSPTSPSSSFQTFVSGGPEPEPGGAGMSPTGMDLNLDSVELFASLGAPTDLDWIFQSLWDGGHSGDPNAGGGAFGFLPPPPFDPPTGAVPEQSITLATGSVSDQHQSDDKQQASPNAQEPAARYDVAQGPQHDSWLLDDSVALQRQPLRIPPLGAVGRESTSSGTHFQLRTLGETGRARILENAEALLSQPPWAPVSLGSLPSSSTLDHCVDLYFLHFCPPIQFIHRPTFDPAAVPEFLLLSMVGIGAHFSRMSGASAFATSMFEMARRLMLSVAEHDPRATRSEYHLTSQLLQAMHAVGVGHRTMFQYGKQIRPTLIYNARQVGLFQEPTISPCTPQNPPDTVEGRWRSWIAAETRRRLGWAIYNFDALSSLLHNERPTFSTGDMLLTLPEDSARWEAPTAYAWAALRPWSSAPDERIDFRTAARGCVDPRQPKSVQLEDEQHFHIIVSTLARFLWSIKELQASPLMDAVPEQWPLVQHKRTLLSTLDRFLSCPYAETSSSTGPDSESGLRGAVVRTLAIRLCHLYGAGDLMDWLPAVLRSAGRNKMARGRMFRWGQEDAVRLREVAFHAAQILAISRDFPFNFPAESFYVFYAGAALWCAAVLLEKSTCEDSRGSGTAVRLDGDEPVAASLHLNHPTAGDEAYRLRVEGWIREGSDVVALGAYGVPDLRSSQARTEVLQETIRILKNMWAWDISRAFSSVLQKLLIAERGSLEGI